MLAFEYIDDNVSLEALVEQYEHADLLVLDTEFVRTRTYYAKLGLIQAYDGKTLALIDPLAVTNLSVFWALLTNPNIMKILHSCSEDLDVFAHYAQCQPSPLFDSQLGASLSSLGHSLGYANLVEQLLNVSLDKGESRTDWLKRPLSQAQLDYAANDVYYLYELYPQLIEKLQARDRLDWVFAESERMSENRLIPVAPDEAYLKVKNAFQLLPKQLACLRDLAKWRLEVALARDMALGFVIKDHALIALAKKQPQSVSQLAKVTELTDQERRVHGKKIIEIINQISFDNVPDPIDVIALKTGYKSAFKAIKQALVSQAELKDVPIELLGSKRYIHEYLRWLWDGKKGDLPLVLTGWRADVVGDLLGEITL
ncbi:ribonuclease D [Shewanella surugensis]|uniref:Ribonuclease D n=1 Tax=Shewanella surugensis TaxID=212020 RepID=A0ABT0LC35_9GAMM|nr:ribonuclease D [Shewanella surugensis]MCL1125267.1 ribonuclease D [Shewanella surugensis]